MELGDGVGHQDVVRELEETVESEGAGVLARGGVQRGVLEPDGVRALSPLRAWERVRPALRPDQARQPRECAAAGERRSTLAKEYGISRETVYSYLRAATATGVPD
ncbi:helix-turn-helix domain-containing protein [Streptomyces sp. NPDC052020]|uniref:helix-turn-helix domain-containing protein n=1 Tax=Streptomyces sp. NPDC052020 TaxID=3155677 RepID=UPI00342901C3